MSMLSNLELLRRVPLFAALTPTQSASIADAIVKKRFKRAEMVVEQGNMNGESRRWHSCKRIGGRELRKYGVFQFHQRAGAFAGGRLLAEAGAQHLHAHLNAAQPRPTRGGPLVLKGRRIEAAAIVFHR